MNSSDYNLLAFKSISDFVKQLCEIFATKNKNHSLKLYEHLLNKTTLSHEQSIKRHIELFKIFCIANREAILNKNSKNLVQNKVEYSTRVYIDFSNIFAESDKETTSVIWKHLLTISALVDPAGKAKEILKNKTDSKEANFLSDIINKVENNVNPGSNPLEAMSSIMSSGVFNDLISGMNTGIQSGELDLSKLMGTVQTMCASLSLNEGSDSEGKDSNPLNMINSLVSNMQSNDNPQLKDLTSMLGPMLSTLNASAPVESEKNIPIIKEINETE